MDVVESVFKRYDIRGSVPQEIDEEFSFKLGISLAKYVLGNHIKDVVIGGDLRDTTPYLKNAFIKGLQSQGVFVYDVGVAPTDLVGFMSKEMSNVGISITASHNSFEMNGFKFMHKSLPFTNEMLGVVKDIFRNLSSREIEDAKNKVLSFEPFKTPYKEIHYDAYKRYVDTNLSLFNVPSWDNALFFVNNSALTPILRYVKRNIYGDIRINDCGYVVDKSLPSEPACEFINSLDKEDSEIIFVFDPDADRVLVYDKEVGCIDGNNLLAAFAMAGGYEMWVTSIDFSEILTSYLQDRGIEVIKTRVGDVFVSNEAYQKKVLFFGEPNNHLGFGDVSYYHSGFSASLFYLSHRERVLEVLNSLPKMYMETIKVSHPPSIDSIFTDAEIISKVDGVKYRVGDCYILIRSSGTENLYKVYVESPTKSKLSMIKSRILEVLKEH